MAITRRIPTPTATTLGGIKSIAAAASQWLRSIGTDGVATASQPTFTDIGGNLAGSQMPTDFETAGIGYFFALWGFGPPPTGGVGLGLGASKFIYATLVTEPITVRKIAFNVTTFQAASKIYVALYDSSKNLVANSSTGGVVTTSNGVKSTTLGTPVTLNPGLYYVFIQGDTAGLVVDGVTGATNSLAILNQNVTRVGTPTNGVSAGAVPSSLGTLNTAVVGAISILFEA